MSCWSGFSSVVTQAFPFPRCPLCPHVGVHQDLCSNSLRLMRHLNTLFGILLHRRCVYPLPLSYSMSICISIDSWIFISYFGCSPTLPYHCIYLFCSNRGSFGHWVIFQPLPLCLPLCLSTYHHGRVLFYFVGLGIFLKCSRLILCISCPSPRVSHFSKEPWRTIVERLGEWYSSPSCALLWGNLTVSRL